MTAIDSAAKGASSRFVLSTVLPIVLFAVIALVIFVVVMRVRSGGSEEKLRAEIEAYVKSKGGTVTFDTDGNGMTVEGSLGKGHERLTALRIMLSSASNREQVIGFALRKYLPDQFDALFEKNANARLDAAAQSVATLSADDLRSRVRIAIKSTRTPSAGLATCARPIVEGYEARVVVDGFDLDGIPEAARARIPEDDATLFELALGHTLGDPPSFEAYEADAIEWLAAPHGVFGGNPALIGAEGKKLVWASPSPEDASRALARFCDRVVADGPLKGMLFGWAGAKIIKIPMMVHTIKGPETPDFTIDLPPVYCAAFGLTADANGRVLVRR